MLHGTVPMTPGQWKELCAALVHSVPIDLDSRDVAALLKRKGDLRIALEPLYYPSVIRREEAFVPSAVFGANWRIWRGNLDHSLEHGPIGRDERSFALTKLDLRRVQLKIMLPERQTWEVAGRHLEMLKERHPDDIWLDPGFALTLRNHPERYPEAWKGKEIFWDGLAIRDPMSNRHYVSTVWREGRVEFLATWQGAGRDANQPTAVLGRE